MFPITLYTRDYHYYASGSAVISKIGGISKLLLIDTSAELYSLGLAKLDNYSRLCQNLDSKQFKFYTLLWELSW